MAHRILYDLVADLCERLDLPDPVVEFGSLQVEDGQPNDLRPLFAGRDFVGTDFREGAGVDRVEDLRALSLGDGTVGTALCLDTLEHCVDPFAACRELHRVLAPNGVCLITSVMLIGIHAHPSDYWRFTPAGFNVLLSDFESTDVAYMGDPDHPFYVFGLGAKRKQLDVRLAELPSLTSSQRAYEQAAGKLKIGPFRYSTTQLAREIRHQIPRVLRERVSTRIGP